MKIVFQHNDILPVKKYGGIERMIFWHMKELVRQGHEAILIGHPLSDVEKYGIKLIPQASAEWWKQIPAGTDGIQLFYNFTPPTDIPIIHNIGGNGKHGEKFHINTVFVSRKHAQNHNSSSYVYNAIDINEYPFEPKENKNWNDFLFLAKASWKVKNLKDCVLSCKEAKKNLHVCGGRNFWPNKYIKNHGMIGGEEKLQIMKSCDAFLFPVRWQEPFGLAVIEAMSQGLPAFTSSYGSLPELISNERLGKVLSNSSELVEILREKPLDYDPEYIRNHIVENFHIDKFTSSYVELFKKVAAGETLNQTRPEWSLSKEAQQLLPF
tara:strand:- start:146476 stop:147444 length:969 start_codon:yes stop_codon:yes gene_type:complete